MAWERLSKKDRKHERAKAAMERQTKACLRNQCGDKIQHEDFWAAMMHCGQLCQLTGNLYSIYCCEDCGFAHVGHTDAPSITWMMGGYSETFGTKLSNKTAILNAL